MTEIRHPQSSDQGELASLWSLRFGDSEAFIDWFFRERFSPAHSFCMTEDGRIAGVIHGWPMRLRIRGVPLPALMLCGVATLPGYEKRGYMHALMRETLQFARHNGFPLVFHKPNRFETYASLGQFPCTRTLYHRIESGVSRPRFSDDWPVDALLAIYQAASAPYSGCVLRDQSAMRIKLADYISDGARLIHQEDGYAVLFEQEDGAWYGEEVLALHPAAYKTLLARLPSGTLAKLPPDLPFSGEIRPQNAMGAADIGALLRALSGDPSLVVSVSDPAVPQNNGIFDGSGAISTAEPQLCLSAGTLLQYLCGYAAYGPLHTESCFCVDEY